MQTPLLNHPTVLSNEEVLSSEQEQLLATRNNNRYENPRSSINLPFDEELHATSKQLTQTYTDPQAVVIIGIGGSNLGTKAVHQAIKGTYQANHTPKAYFADTIDSQDLQQLQEQLDTHYQQNEQVLLVAISKSGSTTETIANLQLLLKQKQQHTKNWQEEVIIITGKNSKLDLYAQKHALPTTHIPEAVGGRFSVLSPVGLVPLQLLGIDTEQLLTGARKAVNDSTKPLKQNPAAQRASNRYQQLQANKNVHELFVFSKQLAQIGAWTRQLFAESLGKNGKGFTPTTAIGSTDLHSVAQLRLAGNDHTHTTFLTLNKQPTLTLARDEEFATLVEDLQEKPLSEVLHAIAQATKHAYKQANRSFDEILLEQPNEQQIGYLLQLLMLETMYLAALLDIDAFNQPAVELYKTKTRELLQK